MRPSKVAAVSAALCATIVMAAAPASAESAVATIGLLEASGYDVYIDRVGSAPLEDCIVTSVRNPQTVTRLVRIDRGHGRFDVVKVIVHRSIAVSLDCTNRT